ncbi:MAG: sulfatase [Planctomycetaceae bacterium]
MTPARKSSLGAVAVVVAFAWPAAYSADLAAQTESPRPNVIFITLDDMNDKISAYGSDLVRTPQIERLAARGVRFDRAYCQNPFCMPSRTSFLSGRRPGTLQKELRDAAWMPHYFREQGYFTAAVGKVVHSVGFASTQVEFELTEGDPKPALSERDRDDPDANFNGGRVVRRTIELMEQPRDRPFFIAVGLKEPHSGWRVPAKYYEAYPPEKVVLREEPAEHRKDIPAVARAWDQTRPEHDEWTDEQKRKRIADFQARYAYTDAQLGVLLDALDRMKLWENTVVLLVGDHGMHFGEHGFWGKRSLFEESCRIPLIVAAPGVRGGRVSPRLVEHIDVYPTLADACGLPVPDSIEGTSFVPLLKDPERPWKKAAFTQTERPLPGQTVENPSEAQRALDEEKPQVIGRRVRTERYAYVEWGDEKTAQLYDLEADSHEYVNFIGSAAHRDVLAEMRRLLKGGWKAAAPK